MSEKIKVTRSALLTLEIAINSQADQKTEGSKLFCTGGDLERADLETEWDWMILNAALRIMRKGKLKP